MGKILLAVILVLFAAGAAEALDKSVVVQASQFANYLPLPDAPGQGIGSRYTNIAYGAGTDTVTVWSSSKGSLASGVDMPAQADLNSVSTVSGATSFGVYTATTLTSYTPDRIQGTQTRTHFSIGLPSEFSGVLGTATSLGDRPTSAGSSNIWGTITAGRDNRYNFDFVTTLPFTGRFDWDNMYINDFRGWQNAGVGFTDFISEDGLEYTGSLDLDSQMTLGGGSSGTSGLSAEKTS